VRAVGFLGILVRIDLGLGYRVYYGSDVDTVAVLFCGSDWAPCIEARAPRQRRGQAASRVVPSLPAISCK
jgi:putative component of toxin-antitoxin plasmid stabilization module